MVCHDKCSGCHHTATAKPGAKSEVTSLGRACQKSCFKIPQFPCVAQEILWVITHNAQLGAGYSCSQLLPNSFFLCVTLLWSPVVLALQRASKELLLLETQGRGWEQLGREGAMAEQHNSARHSTEATPPRLVTTANFRSQHTPRQEAGEGTKGKFLQLTGEQRCVSRLKCESEGSAAWEGSSPLLHPHRHSPAPGQHLSYLLRLDQFELHAPAGPGDEVGVGRVIQEGDQELPELQGAAPLVGRALTVQGGLLLHFTCLHKDTWLNSLALPLSQLEICTAWGIPVPRHLSRIRPWGGRGAGDGAAGR